MENTIQKLDILFIDDKLNLSIAELQKRAEFIASEEALAQRWRSHSVSYSGAKPEKIGEFLRYAFDVYGLPSENTETATNQTQNSLDAIKPNSAAAPEAEV